jgi:hypothetical protein
MGMGSRRGWSRSRARWSRSTRARSIPPFAASSRKAAAEWKQSETGRDAKFYSLTPAGRRQLAVEKDSWARLSGAVNLIFEEGSR